MKQTVRQKQVAEFRVLANDLTHEDLCSIASEFNLWSPNFTHYLKLMTIINEAPAGKLTTDVLNMARKIVARKKQEAENNEVEPETEERHTLTDQQEYDRYEHNAILQDFTLTHG
jgi:hypothetical protein